MPISSIVTQPGTNALMSAYRPVVFIVRATRTDGDSVPPVVYCDIYIDSVFYKTQSHNQYDVLNSTDSDWIFDIQDPCQEVMNVQIGGNGDSSIILTSGVIHSVFCKFRSSGIDVDGFIVNEGTAPTQGTGRTVAISGTGTQSNTIFVVNATLQHENNQNLSIHLAAYKKGVWSSTTYPLTHRDTNYRVCPKSSDYFPIMSTLTPDCIRLHYRYRGASVYTSTGCGGGGQCTPVGFSGTLPDATLGVPYSANITLTGDSPFVISNIVKPAWMTVALSGGLVHCTGTPSGTGTGIVVSFTVTNCTGTETANFSDTINIIVPCVDVTIFGGSPTFPSGTFGTPYSLNINLNGTLPFALSVTTKPSWMSITLNQNLIEVRGTPTNTGTQTVNFTITNCSTGSVTVSTTFSVAPLTIGGTVTIFNTVNTGGGSNGGIVQLHVTFSPTIPVGINLYFGEIIHLFSSGALIRTGTNIMGGIPPGTLLSTFYGAPPLDANKPWTAPVLANTPFIDIKPPIGDFGTEGNYTDGIWQQDAPQDNTFGGTWQCSPDGFEMTDLYIRIDNPNYIAAFTSTGGTTVIHNTHA